MNWGWIVVGAVVAYTVIVECAIKPRRWRRDYWTDWQAHNEAAFHPKRTLVGGDERHYVLTRVAEEWTSESGRFAVGMQHGQGSGVVVHEVNQNGTFSKKGPYFIKNQPRIWQRTGRRHIVEVEIGRREFETTNPSGGRTRERGLRVVELNTTRYAPLTLRQYGERRDRDKARGAGRT